MNTKPAPEYLGARTFVSHHRLTVGGMDGPLAAHLANHKDQLGFEPPKSQDEVLEIVQAALDRYGVEGVPESFVEETLAELSWAQDILRRLFPLRVRAAA